MPIPLHQIDNRALFESLRSCHCPACGGQKRPWMTLCAPDYYKLPKPMRSALYTRIGEGYLERVVEALRTLGHTEFQAPPE